jgi:hypothetical protein
MPLLIKYKTLGGVMNRKWIAALVCLVIGANAHAFTCSTESYLENFNDGTSGVHLRAANYFKTTIATWFKDHGGKMASLDSFDLKGEVDSRGWIEMELEATATSASGKHYSFTLGHALDNEFDVSQKTSYLDPKYFWCGPSMNTVIITLTILDGAGAKFDEYPADEIEQPEAFNIIYPTDI